VKREARNHLLWVVVIAAVIAPLYFVPALHRVAAPVLNVLHVMASVVHVLVLVGFALLVVGLVGVRLWWRGEMRRAAREAGRWWARPEASDRGAVRQGGREVVGGCGEGADEEVGG
jgi:hypothetical protein